MKIETTAEGWMIPAQGEKARLGHDFDFFLRAMRKHGTAPTHTLVAARAYAREVFEGATRVERARTVTLTVLRANGDAELMRFNSNGSVRTLWNFTTGTARSRVGAATKPERTAA